MANMSLKAALPKVELYLYSLVLTLTVLWSASWIYEASTDNMSKQTFEQSVRRGWPYIGRKMDMADFEWVMWFTKFRNYILFALTGHVLFAKAVSMSLPQYRSTYFMIYGILAVLATMGVSYLMLILSHCILLYGVGLAKQKWLCFAAGLCSLATFKMEPVASWQTGFVTGTFQLQDVLFYGGSGFTIMRCMSFALENVEKKGGNYSILDLLIYNFYLPFFFFGPVMTFDQFHVQVNQSKFARKENEMWNIGKRALVHLAVIILVDVFFHYLYILTIPSDLKLAATLSDWALACLAYFNLVYDWIKAAVLFGVVGTVARLDYLDPPKPPKCITMLYVFAETHFDRGINDWLCKYVYDYLGEDHTNIVKELLATVCTFLVTTLWLGPESVVYIWSVCNCFGLNFELWVQKFFELEAFATIEAKQMSKAMSRRIRGVFGAANFWAIILYNILSLNSVDFALLVAKRLFLAGLFNSLTACGKKLFPSLEVLVFMLLYLFLEGFPLSPITILFVTYCGVQLVKENERKLALEAEKKKVE